ncbi:MAG: cell wall hydrolase [Rhodothermales bacterium]|nr:cell wall hydrolase [Rhodothermales bacterium]MBO6780387.1 cell wall hydrolase [Rhodothermales bacterium]
MIQKPVALYAACFLSFTGVFALSGERDQHTPAPIDFTELMENRTEIDRMNPYEEALLRPRRMTPLPPEKIDSETLWLARAIFSETKRPEEQLLVAWVIRNRVETRYRGRASYQGVVLDPYQFSAFLPGKKTRSFYGSLTPHSAVPGWKTALNIADHVRKSEAVERPFSLETRHFYSERSMVNGRAPRWADGRSPVKHNRPFKVDERRFRFFAGIT